MTKKPTTTDNNKTFGYCEKCEIFYPMGEYILKYDHILCPGHMDEWEQEHPREVELFKKNSKYKRY